MRFLLPNDACARALEKGAKIVLRYPSFSLLEADDSLLQGEIAPLEVITSETISVNGEEIKIPEGEYSIDKESPRTLIRFIGPIARQWYEQLNRQNVAVKFWCPPYGACVQFSSSSNVEILKKEFPFIAGSAPYDEGLCTRKLDKPSTGIPASLVDIVCFSREERAEVESLLKKRTIQIVGSSSSKIRVKYQGDLKDLRDIKGVKLADYARTTILTGTPLSDSCGINSTNSSPETSLLGEGQIIAVADTGLDRGANDDSLHPDFKGTIRAITSWPVNRSWDTFVTKPGSDDGAVDKNSGHGTHVAGLALGSGVKSGGKHCGIAPKAQLVFQAIEQYCDVKPEHQAALKSGYYLNGRPMDLRELFKQAYEYGARIHVNAWGDPVSAAYTDDCYEADDFLRTHQDSVMLFAAGNDGTDINGDRVIDQKSLYAPASAKNVLSIGATEGPKDGIGLRETWAVFDSKESRFKNRTDRTDFISGEPDRSALFSSAGPTSDGRIKPDICVPGTNLAAPRSQSIAGQAWGLASPLPYYMYWGGTSTATGVAGGCMALLREAWQKKLGGRAPSGAALKALAVLGTRDVLKRADNKPEPAHVAGFGRLYIDDAIPQSSLYDLELIDESDPGLFTGEMREFTIEITKETGFRAVLAWYDAPGERLINDLDLCIVYPDGKTVWGNHFINTTSLPDRKNTVESINIRTLPAGKYLLRVIAHNIPVVPQGFGLAIRTGRGCRKKSEAPVTTSGTAPASFTITLPVTQIQGFTKNYEKLLADNGIKNIGMTVSADMNIIKSILKKAAVLTLARIELLVHILGASLPAGIDRGLTLSDIFEDARPDSVTLSQWQSTRRALLPLIFVFDNKTWDSIRLSDLWSL